MFSNNSVENENNVQSEGEAQAEVLLDHPSHDSILENIGHLSLSQLLHNFESDSVIEQGKEISRLPFIAGDSVKVTEKIGTRIQHFSGVVIRICNKSSRTTITVRKEGNNKIEKTFSVYSPHIIEIKVLRRGIVRRAKLYYLRDLSGKKARIKERLSFKK